ncbi:MAG TPA: hypothetical protein ENI43_03545, partial [Firmicutes bacterium]|nr:hypothetical protein [Bacillota bacterium]
MKYILTAISVVSICCSVVIAYDWHYYILDSGHYFGGPIDTDSDDNPHILYPNSDSKIMIYKYYDGDEWIEEYVDEWYGRCSMVLDDQDTPHISFREWTDEYMMYCYYCYKDGDEWVIELVDDEQYSGDFNDIVLDSNGYPHISYTHSYVYLEDSDLRYAYFDGSEWHKEVVDDEYDDQGDLTSIALDSNDYPHITYVKFEHYTNDRYLNYTYWDGSDWNIENIDIDDDWRIYNSIVIDSQDIPHVAYIKQDNYDLMYA